MVLSVDQKKLKATKFPPEFDQPVDKDKVNMDLMKKWIAGKIESMVGDDDILIETIFNWLEEHKFVSTTTCTTTDPQLTSLPTGSYQRYTDLAGRLSRRQRRCYVLQGALGLDAQCSGEPSGCS